MKSTNCATFESAAVRRLNNDYQKLLREPLPSIYAKPLPTNIFEWHFVMVGQKESPYEGGYFHGKIIFPQNFPHAAPRFYMITPSGRFYTERSICLSISHMHMEQWSPVWSISSVLVGLYGFMHGDEPTTGGMFTSEEEKRELARSSWEFNLNDEIFLELFPDITGEIYDKIERETARMNNEAEEPSAPAPEVDNHFQQPSYQEAVNTVEQENARTKNHAEEPSTTAPKIDTQPQQTSYQESFTAVEQQNVSTEHQAEESSTPAPMINNQLQQTSYRELLDETEPENPRTKDEADVCPAPAPEFDD